MENNQLCICGDERGNAKLLENLVGSAVIISDPKKINMKKFDVFLVVGEQSSFLRARQSFCMEFGNNHLSKKIAYIDFIGFNKENYWRKFDVEYFDRYLNAEELKKYVANGK